MDDEDELERFMIAYSPKFQSILAAARKEIRKGKDIPHEELWQEVKQD